MKEFTKAEFRELLDNNEIDLRSNNICYYMGVKYELVVLDKENIVKLKKVKNETV